MDFFSSCKTKEDAKKIFRQLAKMFHPDKSGDSTLMLELQRQHDAFDPNKTLHADIPNNLNRGYEWKRSSYTFNTTNRHQYSNELDQMRNDKEYWRNKYHDMVYQCSSTSLVLERCKQTAKDLEEEVKVLRKEIKELKKPIMVRLWKELKKVISI